MTLCEQRGRFLFEVRPDLFPQGRVTLNEMQLWGLFYEEQDRMRTHG